MHSPQCLCYLTSLLPCYTEEVSLLTSDKSRGRLASFLVAILYWPRHGCLPKDDGKAHGKEPGQLPVRTRFQFLTLLSSWSWAVRSTTCCLTCLCSVVSFSSFSFILFKVCIISSFSWVFASHSRSFFSNFCCSSLCSAQEDNWV